LPLESKGLINTTLGQQHALYLGVHFVKCRTLKCSLDAAKCGFYRAANSIFGKIGRIVSEEVVLQLIKSKCVLVLLYGLEACVLNKSQMASLDFVVNRFFMKLFNTNKIYTVKACQEFFSFDLVTNWQNAW